MGRQKLCPYSNFFFWREKLDKAAWNQFKCSSLLNPRLVNLRLKVPEASVSYSLNKNKAVPRTPYPPRNVQLRVLFCHLPVLDGFDWLLSFHCPQCERCFDVNLPRRCRNHFLYEKNITWKNISEMLGIEPRAAGPTSTNAASVLWHPSHPWLHVLFIGKSISWPEIFT